jgi:peptide/nickel transport system substrate-binding protein
MQRRTLLAAGAAALAPPAIGRGAEAKPLRFVPEADLAILDPIWTTTAQTVQHSFLIYDTLWGQDGQFRPQPQMLAGHTVEADGKLWRLTLRDGLRWHDGPPVLARDCVASIQRWGRRDVFGQALMAATEEITAADDKTILIRLSRPFPVSAALSKTTANVPAMMPERVAKTDAFTAITETIGSGPFRFVANERVPGARVVYERNPAYVPRPDGTPAYTAGPKRALVDRVEWVIMPEAATAVQALQAGEVDWVLTPNADLIDSLKRSRGVTVRVLVPTGSISCMRFNQMQAPFNNPALRRAILPAIVQSDYQIAMNGDDRSRWNDGVGFFCPQLPMASDEGMAALTGPRSLDAARRAVEQAGYKGERIVLMGPGDVPYSKILADVTNDTLGKLGFHMDYQVMDWGTLVQRRAKTDPVENGGWSVFHTNWNGPDQADPAVHVFLRGNGKDAAPGWPNDPAMEALRADWLRTTDLPAQQAIARRMQALAFQNVPYIPLGQTIGVTAHRSDLQGMLTGAALFWNINRG